jgi:hypothetical protein
MRSEGSHARGPLQFKSARPDHRFWSCRSHTSWTYPFFSLRTLGDNFLNRTAGPCTATHTETKPSDAEPSATCAQSTSGLLEVVSVLSQE